METIRVEIINPKAKSILDGLADLKLIKIRKEKGKSNFSEILSKLRINSESAPNIDEITAEVEAVRKERYEN
jgi:trehalose-6-phosphate synthase